MRAIALAAVALVAGVTPVVTGADSRTPWDTPRIQSVAATTCADVLLLGVEGPRVRRAAGASYSPVLQVFASAFQRAAAGGRSVRIGRIVTGGAKAGALVGANRGLPAAKAVTKARVRSWAAPVDSAAAVLLQRLASERATCPAQQIVLAGTAQGAMVVHRVLARLDTTYAQQVVGAALVADGDRRSPTRARVIGAPAAKGGRGVVAAKLPRVVPDIPTPAVPARVVSICTAGDIVCDLRKNAARDALAVHASYTAGRGAARVRLAAQSLWDRTMAWPRAADLSRAVVPIHQRFSVQLPVDVGASYASSVRFENATGLPAGTALGPTGRLTGLLPAAGSWNISFTVRSTAVSSPVVPVSLVLTGGSDPSMLSTGGRTSCEVRADATAWCWGDNAYSQIGDGTTRHRRQPVQVGTTNGTATGWARISTSGSTTCGVKTDASLWCWGMNNRGQVGIGGTATQRQPMQVASGRAWRSVSNGWVDTCAIAVDGSAWCWGDGAYGQLGTGSTATRDRPQRIGTAYDWSSIAVGGYHACAVKNSGAAYCWGKGTFGQLGNGSTSRRLSPVRVAGSQLWQRLYTGWSSTCGLDAAGNAWCWGFNDKGQLGNGSTTNRTTPALVPSRLPWTAMSLGDSSTCGLALSGAALCWGSNRYGQLGNGTTSGTLLPVAVRSAQTWTAIDGAWFHACANALDGARSCWGNNERGQLGVGDTTTRTTPRGTVGTVRVRSTLNRRYPGRFTATTVNVLGSEKTEPGGGAPTYAPGRLRTDWLADYLLRKRAGIVGFQELMPDQLEGLRTTFPAYQFWPGMTYGVRGNWTTMMWDGTVWEKLAAEQVMIPFLGKTRPNTLVLLRNKVTRKRLWVFNIHNSAHAQNAAERLAAMRIEAAKVRQKRATGVPVVLLGDLNEHKRAFCFFTSRTDLRAVTGGRPGPPCRPPSRMRVDWVFASKKIDRLGFLIDNSTSVEGRITDHAIVHGRLSL